MSAKYSFTTADYLPWNTMLNLVLRLYKDGKYRMSLLIACGSFLGLRFSDLLTLTWEQLLEESFSLDEKKTGKHREIKIKYGPVGAKLFSTHLWPEGRGDGRRKQRDGSYQVGGTV